MRHVITKNFAKQYAKAPKEIQKAFDKQLCFLLDNSRHPSLDAKPYGDTNQARVTRSWRFYFDIANDTYILTAITKHPK